MPLSLLTVCKLPAKVHKNGTREPPTNSKEEANLPEIVHGRAVAKMACH
jgi:hypothetical protein